MPIDYDALIKKEKQKLQLAKSRLAEIESKKRTADRAARTRELIQLGGLVAIAREITGETLTPKRLMGLLKYGHSASLKNENTGMLSSWDEVGEKIFAERHPQVPVK